MTDKDDFGHTMTPLRIGLGADLHRLVPGDGFHLGGVFIPAPYSVVADSDGDVLLHALVDAMLGALSLGDIGERYPGSLIQNGESSSRFVAETRALLKTRHAQVVNVDCVVHLEAVRLSPHKNAIRDAVATLLAIPPGNVGIKAKTAEGLGEIGTNQAIAAQAVVLVSLFPAADKEGTGL